MRRVSDSEALFLLGTSARARNGPASPSALLIIDTMPPPFPACEGLPPQAGEGDAHQYFPVPVTPPEADPTDETAAWWYSEGLAREKEKKWPEAIAAFQNCIALDANHSSAWFELGYAFGEQNGATCEAEIEPYARCIALDPNHAEAHCNLGKVLENVRKDYDGAEKMYRKAMELDPTYPNPHWDLSIILDEQKNDIPGAVKLMEEFVNLGGIPGWNDGKDRLARLRAKLK